MLSETVAPPRAVIPIMDKEQERDDTQAEHGRETEAPAPVVCLSAEDIAAIASTVAQIL